jgi:hypothetical protein
MIFTPTPLQGVYLIDIEEIEDHSGFLPGRGAKRILKHTA